MPRHLLTGAELSAAELDALLDRAIELKGAPLSSRALAGRGVALIFEKPSTRTRLSFEMGVYELGGHPLVLRSPCKAPSYPTTAREAFGALAGLRLAYVGDGTNVARSLAILGTLAGMDVAIASPPGYSLEQDLSLPPGAG